MSTPIENNTQELQEILEQANNLPNKTGGLSVDVCTVTFVSIATSSYNAVLSYTAFESGQIITRNLDRPFIYSDEYDTEVVTIENVVKNTSIIFNSGYDHTFIGENMEYSSISEFFASEFGMPIFDIKILGDSIIEVHDI